MNAIQSISTQIETLQQTLSAKTLATPDISALRPLSEIVGSTLKAAGSRSEHTARAYTTGIGMFLQWPGAERRELLPYG